MALQTNINQPAYRQQVASLAQGQVQIIDDRVEPLSIRKSGAAESLV